MPAPGGISAVGRPNPASARRWGDGSRLGEVSCSKCGDVYLDYRKRLDRAKRHYCSSQCQRADRTADANPNFKGKADKTCAICGIPTKQYGKPARRAFCSMSCAGLGKKKPARTPRTHLTSRPLLDMYGGVNVNVKTSPSGYTKIARAVPGFDGYFVTDSGEVVTFRGRVLKPYLDPGKRGYWRVTLRRDRHSYRMQVHILVACAWLPPRPSPFHIVAHGDGDKLNVAASNLRWATQVENAADKVGHGTAVRGSKVQWSKLLEGQVLAIRQKLQDGASVAALAEAYSVSEGCISHIRARTSWRHI